MGVILFCLHCVQFAASLACNYGSDMPDNRDIISKGDQYYVVPDLFGNAAPTKITRPAMNSPDSQILALVAASIAGLKDLSKVLLDERGSPSEVAAIESHLSRFKLWARGLGAHRVSGTRSLEYRLREASFSRRHLVFLIEDLKTLICTEGMYLRKISWRF